ncbi:hypothetical protein AUQ37_01670 [Candidatus Methanomethylophilus sp. 1R26]|uniref:hypothetical protein n=1 Tax=Candidatus Methanomethylophilus sp. 1R26 TaxID=1769296 RepID=UPI0007364F5A|nr:hypothetical protein [Candidatus Methanomethylophilus sp. 1R26]KUE73641.1 hypothetical protein AUQ37_01670 [Candidatus Methanomethylophilus sp. 1R26]
MKLRDEEKIQKEKDRAEARRKNRAMKDEEARKRTIETERDRVRRNYAKNSAGHREMHNLGATILKSSLIILVAVAAFEIACFILYDTWGDGSTHLINLADNSFAFIVGLTAMDAIMYINQANGRKRSEERAIIRHNRILQPAIDMYLARKNMMLTPPGDTSARTW